VSGQYFTTPDSPAHRRMVTARIWDTDYTFATAGGVFSADGLDHATALLFRHSRPPVQARRVLDLGCGWGPIAVALARTCPMVVVDAIDVNDRALGLCAENARAAGVAERVRVFRPESADQEVRYDEIWSNPPIRIGKTELHALLTTWLVRLTPAGTARLVVGKNLGADTLQRWLADQGWRCERTASAKGFRVFAVTRS